MLATKALCQAQPLLCLPAILFPVFASISSLGFCWWAARGVWCGLSRKSSRNLQEKSNLLSVLIFCLAVLSGCSLVYWRCTLFWVCCPSFPRRRLQTISTRAFLLAHCITITCWICCSVWWFNGCLFKINFCLELRAKITWFTIKINKKMETKWCIFVSIFYTSILYFILLKKNYAESNTHIQCG